MEMVLVKLLWRSLLSSANSNALVARHAGSKSLVQTNKILQFLTGVPDNTSTRPEQAIALTGRNHTGLPCSVGRPTSDMACVLTAQPR